MSLTVSLSVYIRDIIIIGNDISVLLPYLLESIHIVYNGQLSRI